MKVKLSDLGFRVFRKHSQAKDKNILIEVRVKLDLIMKNFSMEIVE